MREIKQIAVTDIQRDPDQPRKQFDEAELRALGENMKAMGQIEPIIVVEYEVEEEQEKGGGQ